MSPERNFFIVYIVPKGDKGESTMEIISENQTCPTVGYQAANICVPVSVEPYAKAGATLTKCCGNPTVIPGRQICGGVKIASTLPPKTFAAAAITTPLLRSIMR